MNIPGDKLPSGICSVMVSVLAMSWNLMILLGKGQFSFFLIRDCKLVTASYLFCCCQKWIELAGQKVTVNEYDDNFPLH